MKTIRHVVWLALLLVACAPSYRLKFEEQAKKEGWTKNEVKASYYYSFRVLFGKPNEDGTFGILYSRLPKAEVVKQIDRRLKDLADILNPKNERLNRYIKEFGLGEHFERQEKIFKAIRARMLTAHLHDTFEDLLRQRRWYSGKRDKYGYDHSRGYDLQIFLVGDLGEMFPFKSKLIEEVRQKGWLKEVERSTFEHYRKFDRKEPDPNFPDDPRKFLWQSKKYALEVVKYKIMVPGEKPENNFGNYVEVFRLNDNGRKESAPAIKAFLDGKGSSAVAVIDINKEQEVGFGLPDFVEKISESDLISPAMFERLFPNEEKYKRIEPKRPPIRLEIARVGEPIDTWEKADSPQGWTVPFSYKREPTPSNYNVRLKFKRKKSDEKTKDHDRLREIEYVMKEWFSNKESQWVIGQVVEYFRPKSPYSEPLVEAKVLFGENMKKVQVFLSDGTEKTVFVTPGPNVFIENEPEAVAYTLGKKRWFLKDEDGDGKYEKRKQISLELEHKISAYESSK